MSQYFENDNNLASNIRFIEYTYKNKKLKYKVDNGVFSKDRVDFGTNVLLNTLPSFLDNSKILDMGCGYGPIGLAIALSNITYDVHMVDVNQRAIDLAIENKRINKINNATIYESYLYENVKEQFDCIISNPPIRAGKDVVHQVFIDGYNHLKENGQIILVIQKKQGAESLIKRIEEVFDNYQILEKEKGYFVIRSIKNK